MQLLLLPTVDPCTRCAKCCEDFGPGGLPLTPEEHRRLRGLAKKRHITFVSEPHMLGSLHALTIVSHYVLRTMPCVFYDKTVGCTIYDQRPSICQSFPVQLALDFEPIYGRCEVRDAYKQHVQENTIVGRRAIAAARTPYDRKRRLHTELALKGIILEASDPSLPLIDIDLFLSQHGAHTAMSVSLS